MDIYLSMVPARRVTQVRFSPPQSFLIIFFSLNAPRQTATSLQACICGLHYGCYRQAPIDQSLEQYTAHREYHSLPLTTADNDQSRE